MAEPVRQALLAARRGLLDFSTRNRLLSLPRPGRSTGVVPIAGGRSEAVFRLLVTDRAVLGFAPSVASVPAAEGEAAPKRRRAVAAAPRLAEPDPDDKVLSAPLTEEALARVLTRLERDSRSVREEQGVNILSAALGQLLWRDPKAPEMERGAPLVMVPATLKRGTARDPFRLAWDEGEVGGNLTLAAFLADTFGIRLPAFPELDERDDAAWATLSSWLDAVAEAVEGQPGFAVERDAIAVGLFSFAKFLMYRDLDADAWPEPWRPDAHPLLSALAGATPPPAAETFPDDTEIDALITVEKLDFVLDSDGSQTLASEAVRRGASLVIQGPPGTGKSQVITNLIAQAVIDGKTVLFVAEKLAALEVVQRRLAGVGLGAACLALHGDTANRRALLADLDTTLKAPRAREPDRSAVVTPLGSLRGRLNRHAAAMHAPIGETGWTAFRAIGEAARLKAAGVAAPEGRLDAASWNAEKVAATTRLVREMAATIRRIGPPARHPWRGVTARALAPTEADRIAARIPAALRALGALSATGAATRSQAARRLATLRAAAEFATIRARAMALAPGLTNAAWQAPDLEALRAPLAAGGGFFSSFSSSYREARARMEALCGGALPADASTLIDTLCEGQRVLAAHPDAATTTPDAAEEQYLAAALGACTDALDPLLGDLALDLTAAFGSDDAPIAALVERLGLWAAAPQGALADWLGWARLAREAAESGIGSFTDRLADGSIAPEEAPSRFRRALAESLLAAAMRANPSLAAFDGPAFSRLVEEFREADKARLGLARAEAGFAHAARLRIAEGPDSLREMAVIRGELAKKRGHMPIRTLLSRAPNAIQAIKPVFMMSPLAVAEFLSPGAIAFDLLVIDEASQVEPADAFGAVARSHQMVIVGDDRQMPPTRFFARMTGENGEEEDASDEVQAADVESILSLCNARGWPTQMLRWHYRSRHESLIAVSNEEFYEKRLLVIPSPRPRGKGLGLSLAHVAGSFDSGGTGTNIAEADAVAEAVIAHARDTPGDTLGVAAFSVRQRDAILDAVDAKRRADPSVEQFFAAHPAEPFFVKNLENVQGDERDAMFISVGYARDGEGRLAMRFGPLSAEGGERRLNVLITRAKKRSVVFSGLRADDIDLARASGRGPAVLKRFLAYAAAPDGTTAAGSDDDAALSDAIAGALEGAGLSVARRVGLAGLFVDVAVREPSGEGYGLGILTDGAFYASARSARDRDRLQESALAMMGWRLARSWAADWLVRPDAEAARLAALAGATAAPAEEAPKERTPGPLATPYVVASPEVPRDTPLAEVPFARLGTVVEEIVRVEGPIHADAVIARAASLWAIEAPSPKERAAVVQALRLSKELAGLVQEGEFWRAEDAQTVSPRDRSGLPEAWRSPAWIAPAELRSAILATLEASGGAVARQRVIEGAARLLGIGASGYGALAAQLALLEGEGQVREEAGLVSAA
ncbi:DUF3320 domain-containing protein [Elioraea rosea]|uniref:DUF3320 domain-containing protein n=1 Tax=Elioraea rosea TaxID=2492390 RepID=UPI0013157E71|nr:DUF3320 domain-containing protein [Elioraea rosea]